MTLVALYFRDIDEKSVTLSMEMSLVAACPLTGGISVPAQTVRTSNEPMSNRVFVCMHKVEPVCRCVLAGAWKKRHLHALTSHQRQLSGLEQRPGAVFKELNCHIF